MSRIYTDEELIQLLKECQYEIKKVPTSKIIDKMDDYPHSTTYAAHFGSWSKALVAAGFRSTRYVYSNDELIALLKDFKTTPTIRDMDKKPNFPNASTFIHRFGSWNKALEIAGFDPNYEIITLSDDVMIEQLADFKLKLNKNPSRAQINENKDLPCDITYLKRFGSLNVAFELADDVLKERELNNYRNYNKTKLVQLLKNFYETEGKIPSIIDIDNNDEYPNSKVFRHYFNTWKEALGEADFKNEKNFTKEKLIQLLQTHYTTAPSMREVRRNEDLPHSDTFVNYFGSWYDALRAANFEVKGNYKRYDSKEEILEGLKEFVTELGYYPSRNDVNNNPNLPTTNTYVKKFGSWRNVLEEIGYYD